MTLKEAITEIDMMANECLIRKYEAGAPNSTASYYEGKAAALDEVLLILERVEECVDRDSLIAQVKQWQSEALVQMMKPATKHDSRVYYDGMATAYANVLKTLWEGKEDGTDK